MHTYLPGRQTGIQSDGERHRDVITYGESTIETHPVGQTHTHRENPYIHTYIHLHTEADPGRLGQTTRQPCIHTDRERHTYTGSGIHTMICTCIHT